MTDPDNCPCGRGRYADCCGPFHAGRDQAATAESLMRSRYSAFALGLTDYLWRTWHPRTRPENVVIDASDSWSGLELLDVVGGEPDDQEGLVEFVAHFTDGGQVGRLQERSRFVRRAGRWMYLDGDAAVDG